MDESNVQKRVTRSKAIRLKCLDCCCGSAYEVTRCVSKDCPLWNYRLGHEVDSEGNYTPRRKAPKHTFQNAKNDQHYDQNN